jgi:hypothetical protein
MSSEEMRTELEIFVNEGLREGWRGWPLKGESRPARSCGSRRNVAALRLWRGGRSNPPRLTRRQGLFAIPA